MIRESTKYVDGQNHGFYDIPGGRLEVGENFLEALTREINEEATLDVTVGQPFFVNEWRPVVRGEQWQVVGIFFHCKANNDAVIIGPDHDDAKWIDPEKYRDETVIENLYPAFEAYLAFRK